MLNIQYSKQQLLIKKVFLLITGYQLGPYRGIILPCLFPCGAASVKNKSLRMPNNTEVTVDEL